MISKKAFKYVLVILCCPGNQSKLGIQTKVVWIVEDYSITILYKHFSHGISIWPIYIFLLITDETCFQTLIHIHRLIIAKLV